MVTFLFGEIDIVLVSSSEVLKLWGKREIRLPYFVIWFFCKHSSRHVNSFGKIARKEFQVVFFGPTTRFQIYRDRISTRMRVQSTLDWLQGKHLTVLIHSIGGKWYYYVHFSSKFDLKNNPHFLETSRGSLKESWKGADACLRDSFDCSSRLECRCITKKQTKQSALQTVAPHPNLYCNGELSKIEND